MHRLVSNVNNKVVEFIKRFPGGSQAIGTSGVETENRFPPGKGGAALGRITLYTRMWRDSMIGDSDKGWAAAGYVLGGRLVAADPARIKN